MQDWLSKKAMKFWRAALYNNKEDWAVSFIQGAGTWWPVLLSIIFYVNLAVDDDLWVPVVDCEIQTNWSIKLTGF